MGAPSITKLLLGLLCNKYYCVKGSKVHLRLTGRYACNLQSKGNTHTNINSYTQNFSLRQPALQLQPHPWLLATCTIGATHPTAWQMGTTLSQVSVSPAMCTHLAATSLTKHAAQQFSASGRYQMHITIQRNVPFISGWAKQVLLSEAGSIDRYSERALAHTILALLPLSCDV